MAEVEARQGPARVALVACPDYEPERVAGAVRRCLELLGGLEGVADEGSRVLVKPNLLLAVKPATAVCTHPEVVRAVLGELLSRGAEPVVGDSPMFARPEVALRRSGIAAVMEELGVGAADVERATVVHGPEGRRFRRFDVVASATGCDLLVSLCKLKTHHTTELTLAVKNLFGLIPGMEKSKWHLRAPSRPEMSAMLVDLYEALVASLPPRTRLLHLCDAVVALEGEGPGSAGKPRQVGALAASFDALALDSVLARLVGLGPRFVTTTAEARRRGLSGTRQEEIELVGDPIEDLLVEGFVPCRKTLLSGSTGEAGWPYNVPFVRDRMVERPLVREEVCTGCGECGEVCAAEAIALAGKPPKARIDHDRCIRCYCCVEACRFAAARLGPRPLVGKIADRRHQLPWVAAGLAAAIAGAALWLLWP